jgi:hypothetical protein
MKSFFILLNIKAKKIMGKKADRVRDLITSKGTRPQIVLAIMARCKADPNIVDWKHGAIFQVASILDIPCASARAMVSEYSVEELSGSWKKVVDTMDI